MESFLIKAFFHSHFDVNTPKVLDLLVAIMFYLVSFSLIPIYLSLAEVYIFIH